MLKDLEKKLKFIELIDEMKLVKRALFLRDDSLESDAEHSWHLAMMVLVFSEDFPKLDIEKCLKFALIHDLVEIYAGDTIALDKKAEKTKTKREKEAFLRLEKEFMSSLREIISLIEQYEKRECPESKFVYSLDKIHPIIQVVMEGGKSWHKWKYDFEEIKTRQYSKIYPEFGLNKILDIYFKKAEKENIFYSKNLGK